MFSEWPIYMARQTSNYQISTLLLTLWNSFISPKVLGSYHLLLVSEWQVYLTSFCLTDFGISKYMWILLHMPIKCDFLLLICLISIWFSVSKKDLWRDRNSGSPTLIFKKNVTSSLIGIINKIPPMLSVFKCSQMLIFLLSD